MKDDLDDFEKGKKPPTGENTGAWLKMKAQQTTKTGRLIVIIRALKTAKSACLDTLTRVRLSLTFGIIELRLLNHI